MQNRSVRQFLKFGIVGFSNTIIAYVVYSLGIYWGLHYLLANAFAFLISVLNAYFWSDRYVFKKKDNEERNTILTLIKTIIAYGSTGILLASLLLYIYIDKFGVSEYVAQLLVLLVTIPVNFVMNKFWAFQTYKVNEEN